MARGRPKKASKGARSKKTKKTQDPPVDSSDGNNDTGKSGGGSNKAPRRRNDLATIPTDPSKNLRACMICSLIKSESEFENDGCDNCERWLKLEGIRGSLNSYTSKNFEGMVAMIEPQTSWVAKWQKISHLKAGVYAVNVRGEVERWVKEELRQVGDPGVRYFSRDKNMPNPSNNTMRKRKETHSRTRNDSGGSAVVVEDDELDNESSVGGSRVAAPPRADKRTNREANVVAEDRIDLDEEQLPGPARSDVTASSTRAPFRIERSFDKDSSSSDDDDGKSVSSKSSG